MARGGARPGAGRKPKGEEGKIRELMSPYIPNAIETVINIMNNGEKDADRLAAAKLALAYVFGNPQQTTKLEVNTPKKDLQNIFPSEEDLQQESDTSD